ncbi:MAG: PAS domain-containing protein [Thermodesulfobacteriota bacterium]|nr:PAS domain-containing protein [Thermodesulfobacteriota bacterium]
MAQKPTYEELEQRVKELEKEVDEKARSEDRLRTLSLAIDQSSEGVAVVDLDGKLGYLNPSFAVMHGYSPEELIGKNLSIFHSSEQLPSVDAANRQLKETGDFKGEIWHVRRDGTEFLTSMHNSLIKNAEGKPIGMLGTLRDINDMKRTEEALRESEEQFRLLAENINDAFWMSTPGIDKMIYVSPAYEAIWGRSRDSLYKSPQSFMEAIHPEDRDRVQAGLEGHAKGSWNFEYRIIQPDGSIRWINDRGFPIQNEQGDLAKMCGVATDITERKQAEEALRKSENTYRITSVRLRYE